MLDAILVASYFLHMAATVVWVGGIAVMALVVYPGARRALGSGPGPAAAVIAECQRRFSPLAMLSLVTLIATGLIQMSVNPNYNGFLKIDSTWAAAILLKHLAFGVMALVGAYSVWGLSPALNRLALLESKGKLTGDELSSLRTREERLNRFNLVCALIVLLLTAIARSV
jgi:uncharacterized membrane protein